MRDAVFVRMPGLRYEVRQMTVQIKVEPVYFCAVCDAALYKQKVSGVDKLMHFDFSKAPYNIKCANNGMQLDMPVIVYTVNAVAIAAH